MILTAEHERNHRRTCSRATFSAHISHWLIWDRNRASVMITIVRLLQSKVSYYYYYYYYYYIPAVLTLDAGLLARSQYYPEGPATGHLDTGFSCFPCVYKRMLRWFPTFQVATTCFSFSPPDLNFLVTIFFSYLCTCKITTATRWQPNCINKYYYYYIPSWLAHEHFTFTFTFLCV